MKCTIHEERVMTDYVLLVNSQFQPGTFGSFQQQTDAHGNRNGVSASQLSHKPGK